MSLIFRFVLTVLKAEKGGQTQPVMYKWLNPLQFRLGLNIGGIRQDDGLSRNTLHAFAVADGLTLP